MYICNTVLLHIPNYTHINVRNQNNLHANISLPLNENNCCSHILNQYKNIFILKCYPKQ